MSDPILRRELFKQLIGPVRPTNPAGKCRLASDELSHLLARRGIDHNVVEGYYSGRAVGGQGRTVHWFITIPEQELAADDGARFLILDPTLEQFSPDAYKLGEVGAVSPSSVRPDSGLVPENTRAADAYSGLHRFE